MHQRFRPPTQSELRQLFSEWNQTARAYPRNATIDQLFEEQVRRKPEALAVSFGRSHLTYRQLNERANKLAHHLKKWPSTRGLIAGLCMERCMEMIISLLAILKAGAAYAALDVGLPEERTNELLREMRVPVPPTQEDSLRFNTTFDLTASWTPGSGPGLETDYRRKCR